MARRAVAVEQRRAARRLRDGQGEDERPAWAHDDQRRKPQNAQEKNLCVLCGSAFNVVCAVAVEPGNSIVPLVAEHHFSHV